MRIPKFAKISTQQEKPVFYNRKISSRKMQKKKNHRLAKINSWKYLVPHSSLKYQILPTN